jgi:CheY-like chemotaxis protein
VIRETVERGAHVVQQLLAVGRKAPLSFQAADVNRLLENHAALLHGSFPKTVEIVLRLNATLPSIGVDSNRLNQAILNLCVNARDAMNGVGRIELATGRISGAVLQARFPDANYENYIWISVTDTGLGIDDGTMERVFEPFFTTKAPGEGSGLGLAVVYGIVRDHAGFIDVQSGVGKGAVFCIYLPDRGGDEPKEDSKDPTPEDIAPLLRRVTVLLADDEENQLRLMERFLRAAGYEVLTARDGVAAIDLHRRHCGEIDVAVLDLGLPKLSGWESYRAMQSSDPSLKVLFASGYIEPQIKADIEKTPSADIVKKPYRPDELVAKIGAVTASR